MSTFFRGMEDADIQGLLDTVRALETINQGLKQAAYVSDFNFHIGDLLAQSEYPAVITYRDGGVKKGEIQGYKVGPILIVRLHQGSNQAFGIWTDPVPDLESEMTEEGHGQMLKLRETLSGFKLRNNVEILQDVLDDLLPRNPFIIRAGTFEGLTKPAGRPIPIGMRLALASSSMLPGIIHNASLLGHEAMGQREKMFSKFSPLRKKTNALIARNSQNS